MLAQSAMHDTAGASPTAAPFAGAKSKKRPGFMSGLFSDLLSQAQKGQGASRGEGPRGPARKAEAQGAKSVEAARHASASAKPAPARGLRTGESLAATEARHAEEARARKKTERKTSGQPDELAIADATASKALEGRRLRAAKDAASEETIAIRVQRAAARPGAGEAAQAASKAKPEGDEAEAKVEDKRRKRAEQESKLSFLDLRRSAEARRGAAAASSKGEAKPDESSIKEAVGESKPGGQGRELVRELFLDAGKAEGARAEARTERPAAAGAGDFQSQLSERLREAWNGEIVKSAHIVLRDGDAGTIRLRLRPESLGNIKVELNLTDNNISGRILVESDEAKTAFERNMNQLADAFRQGGFDSARLEVAVGGGSGNGASAGGSGDAGGPFYSERLREAVGSGAEPAVATSAYARRGGAVDILA